MQISNFKNGYFQMNNVNAEIFGNIHTPFNEFEEFVLRVHEKKEKRFLKYHNTNRILQIQNQKNFGKESNTNL